MITQFSVEMACTTDKVIEIRSDKILLPCCIQLDIGRGEAHVVTICDVTGIVTKIQHSRLEI